MKVVIAAGGKGTRIQSVNSQVPKPLIPICGKPVLQREIESLRDQGYTDIIITVSYKAEQIRDYFGDGKKFGVNIEYFVEDIPLGNVGALFKLDLKEDFMFLLADALFDIDFNRFVNFHRAKGGLVTLFTHPNSHPYDSSIIISNNDSSVEAWLTKEDEKPKYYQNRVNAGLHIISPKVLDICGIKRDEVGSVGVDGNIIKVDLDRQLLKPLCGTGKMFCYDSPEYCKDMGTPERLESAIRDLQMGIVQEKNLRCTQKAFFIDRDGTINKHIGFLRSVDEFELLPGVQEAIKKINSSGYLAIVITNQPVIARGEVTVDGLREIHNKMETVLGAFGAYIDAIYYCPHHPHKGYDGEVVELKIICECRKPRPGLLLQAASDFNVDLTASWMVGDSKNDIGAGKNAGCKTAFIGRENMGQDISGGSLLDIVNKILTD
ncbi:D-glycero-D-manno-heptose 1,7-bisphosphate phosphatase [Anaerovibrio lipolyticus DSM 3074]|uniref:D,D-heptose 1,7-bisphosphate phosphatase n=1 Tax=Anaerovibrio lipolyticus DSM 3074 TaxID=1120997 RepID=A0A1M6AMZ3_9FIRM|nr:HAD-IIIA family hydrolase [Anaerovibrio lipolyticus]SHI37870.1 D-glycero-D-manno-heptose 1,7-bisphosphate phosphatase [Anaerovibrio lipolyticus DSM 3074]